MPGAPPSPIARGARVALRRLVRADAPRLVAFVNTPAVRRTMRLAGEVTLAVEEAFIESVAHARDPLVLGITARDDGRLLGMCGLHQAGGDPARQAELGIFIGDPAEWGRGFGGEATRLLVELGFETLDLNRVWLHVHADNEAGLRAYRRVGFRAEGLLRQAAFRDGAFVDVVSMALLRAEWDAGRR